MEEKQMDWEMNKLVIILIVVAAVILIGIIASGYVKAPPRPSENLDFIINSRYFWSVFS